MTNMLGKFITFEGGEGCGKTTQSALLVEALSHASIPHIHTREPGGTEGAEAIRQLLVTGDTNKWDPVTETLLHFAARRDHVTKVIQPALVSGQWVICDRFIHSTLAYQGYGHQLPMQYIVALRNLVIGRVHPCLTFMLDTPPDIGLKRAASRHGTETRYEEMDIAFHKRLYHGFKEMAQNEPERCVLIDATGDIASIHQRIITTVNQRFDLHLPPVS